MSTHDHDGDSGEVIEEFFTPGALKSQALSDPPPPKERESTPSPKGTNDATVPQSPESVVEVKCVACDKAGAKSRCGGCKLVYFCNRACQVKAWPQHKTKCAKIVKPAGASSKTSAKPTTGARKKTGFGSLYSDREDVQEGDELTRESRALLRRLMSSLEDGPRAAASKIELDGMFKRLMDKQEFQRLVFPGISEENRKKCPQSFQELLKAPVYSTELEGIMPKVKAKADSVLSAVKRKGAMNGEYMDAQTESSLRPQVLQEAFAREVVGMVQAVNLRQHAEAARDLTALASPLSEEADNDLLEASLLAGLMRTEGGVGVQDGFMGEGWAAAAHAEAVRLREADRLSGASLRRDGVPEWQLGRLAWLEPEELAEEYPGMSEVVESLHALPFELNKKTGTSLRACVAFPGSTMLRELGPGCGQPARKDGGHRPPAGSSSSSSSSSSSGGSGGSGGGNGVDTDTGYVVTCVYFFWPDGAGQGWGGGDGGILKMRNETSGETMEIEPVADRLVMFRSRDVWNEVETVATTAAGGSARPQYSLLFWIKGKDAAEGLD